MSSGGSLRRRWAADGRLHFPSLTIALPDWVEQVPPDPAQRLATEEKAMGLAIALSRRPVERDTGGSSGQ